MVLRLLLVHEEMSVRLTLQTQLLPSYPSLCLLFEYHENPVPIEDELAQYTSAGWTLVYRGRR